MESQGHDRFREVGELHLRGCRWHPDKLVAPVLADRTNNQELLLESRLLVRWMNVDG